MFIREFINNGKMYTYLNRFLFKRFYSDSLPTTSFLSSVAQGKIEHRGVYPFPRILTSDQKNELRMMSDNLSKFFEVTYDSHLADASEKFLPEDIKKIAELGGLGVTCPEEYEGFGLNKTMITRLALINGYGDLSITIMIGAHQSIGYTGIVLFGTHEQKLKYLPRLASGEHIASYALTEPSAGSDVQSMKSKAVLSPDGKHYILNGSKIWITNGVTADIMTVFAKVPVKDEDGNEKDKITAFILERAFGGVTSSDTGKKMGIRATSSAAVYFDNVKIPVENVLGEVGNGFKIAMHILNNGRCGMVGTLAGSMLRCIEIAAQHASQRVQFGRKLMSFKLIQEKLTNMQIKQYTSESMAFILAGNFDRGSTNIEMEAAISKVYASEAAWFCVDEAIQILGGMGYMRETGLEKIMRDLRIFRIFEGSNEILRIMGVAGTLKELNKVSKTPVHHMIRKIRNTFGLNYFSNKAQLEKVVHPSLHSSVDKLAKSINMTSSALNNALLKYRMKLVTEESVQVSRFADCYAEIFGMACVLSRATLSLQAGSEQGDINSISADHEKRLAELACTLALQKIQDSLSYVALDRRNHLDHIRKLSNDLCDNGTMIPLSPIDI